MAQTVAVIDYGMGNLHSVAKALEHASASARVQVTSDPALIGAADRVVLPGVGAIGDCMAGLRVRGLDSVVRALIGKTPLLGVCVGMQILTTYGEESQGVDALGVFPGSITRFPVDYDAAGGARLKIPHMGWNQVWQRPHPLWMGIPDGARFYFVHSYRLAEVDRADVVGTCTYGTPFAAALAQPGVFAVQFHPEKSQQAGLQLYANFLTWDGTC